MSKENVKTLIEIDRKVWSQTKAFATSNGLNLTTALKVLLTEILSKKGYSISDSTSQISKAQDGDGKCH